MERQPPTADELRILIKTVGMIRRLVEESAERLVAVLDLIDGEPDTEDDGIAEPEVDDEPSLGSTHAIDQSLAWIDGASGHDREEEHDGREPENHG